MRGARECGARELTVAILQRGARVWVLLTSDGEVIHVIGPVASRLILEEVGQGHLLSLFGRCERASA